MIGKRTVVDPHVIGFEFDQDSVHSARLMISEHERLERRPTHNEQLHPIWTERKPMRFRGVA